MVKAVADLLTRLGFGTLPSFPQLEPFDNNIRYLAPIRDGRWTIRGVDLARELESRPRKVAFLLHQCHILFCCRSELPRRFGKTHYSKYYWDYNVANVCVWGFCPESRQPILWSQFDRLWQSQLDG